MIASSPPAIFAASVISGTALNRSTGRPAAGDQVILLRIDKGLVEEARANIDSQGAFTLVVRYPDQPHLVRVVHQGVAYDRQVSGNSPLALAVFDASPKVRAIAANAEIIRLGTQRNLLRVSDMYDIANLSRPPVTQAGERAFEVYLPAEAKIDSVLAAGPAGIGVLVSALAIKGEPGHYAVNFPLRPGDTKFAVNYRLPYNGRGKFQHRIGYPLQQLAIMIPPAMKFTSGSSGFHLLAVGNPNFQVQALNQVQAQVVARFEISGSGDLPLLHQPPASQAQVPRGDVSAATANKPRNPDSPGTNSRSAEGSGWRQSSSVTSMILGAASLLCGLLLWRRKKSQRGLAGATESGPAGKARDTAPVLSALKEELFSLESDRVRGSISAQEYVKTKQAWQKSAKRAID